MERVKRAQAFCFPPQDRGAQHVHPAPTDTDAAERPYLLRALSGEIPPDANSMDAMSVGRSIFGTGRGRSVHYFPTPLCASWQPISMTEMARPASLFSIFSDDLAEREEEAGAITRGQAKAIAARMARRNSQEGRA